jgi:hypothetical protein
LAGHAVPQAIDVAHVPLTHESERQSWSLPQPDVPSEQPVPAGGAQEGGASHVYAEVEQRFEVQSPLAPHATPVPQPGEQVGGWQVP